jgi:hypothetical protein
VTRCLPALLAALWPLLCGTVHADDLRPLYVEVELLAGGMVEGRIRLPPGIADANRPELQLPDSCRPVGPAAAGATIRRFRCDAALAGAEAAVRYPLHAVPNPTIVRVLSAAGHVETFALAAGQYAWTMPGLAGGSSVAAQYTWLGAEHIWIGYDHLLFLSCLIWIAGTLPRVAWMVTGFTLAHSLTLALAALGVLRVPVPWVEAVIALSVVFLAVEITHGRRNNLTWRYPVAVSSSFGLLHGLGFAAVLAGIGLPPGETVTGLLFFNVGVEIGQLLFCAAVLAALHGLRRLAGEGFLERRVRPLAGYAVGCTASYWLVGRVAQFVGPG